MIRTISKPKTITVQNKVFVINKIKIKQFIGKSKCGIRKAITMCIYLLREFDKDNFL